LVTLYPKLDRGTMPGKGRDYVRQEVADPVMLDERETQEFFERRTQRPSLRAF